MAWVRRGASAVFVVGMSATAHVSAAEATPGIERDSATEPTPDTPKARVKEHWYGWQTLGTDGVAALLASGALATGGDETFWGFSIGTYTLGAPLVHLTHGRPWVALGDFALRLGVPFLGMFVGAQVDAHRPWQCDASLDCQQSVTGLTTGGIIGGVAVSALDAAVFAFEPPAPEKHRVLASSGPRIWPSVSLTPRGGRAALVGAF